jgi:hypothetical protein
MPKRVYFGKGNRITASWCPQCNLELDGVTIMRTDGPKDGLPEEGDYSICVYCAAILRFGAGLQLRKATPEDITEARKAPEMFGLLQTAHTAALMAIADRRKENFMAN